MRLHAGRPGSRHLPPAQHAQAVALLGHVDQVEVGGEGAHQQAGLGAGSGPRSAPGAGVPASPKSAGKASAARRALVRARYSSTSANPGSPSCSRRTSPSRRPSVETSRPSGSSSPAAGIVSPSCRLYPRRRLTVSAADASLRRGCAWGEEVAPARARAAARPPHRPRPARPGGGRRSSSARSSSSRRSPPGWPSSGPRPIGPGPTASSSRATPGSGSSTPRRWARAAPSSWAFPSTRQGRPTSSRPCGTGGRPGSPASRSCGRCSAPSPSCWSTSPSSGPSGWRPPPSRRPSARPPPACSSSRDRSTARRRTWCWPSRRCACSRASGLDRAGTGWPAGQRCTAWHVCSGLSTRSSTRCSSRLLAVLWRRAAAGGGAILKGLAVSVVFFALPLVPWHAAAWESIRGLQHRARRRSLAGGGAARGREPGLDAVGRGGPRGARPPAGLRPGRRQRVRGRDGPPPGREAGPGAGSPRPRRGLRLPSPPPPGRPVRVALRSAQLRPGQPSAGHGRLQPGGPRGPAAPQRRGRAATRRCSSRACRLPTCRSCTRPTCGS